MEFLIINDAVLKIIFDRYEKYGSQFMIDHKAWFDRMFEGLDEVERLENARLTVFYVLAMMSNGRYLTGKELQFRLNLREHHTMIPIVEMYEHNLEHQMGLHKDVD